MLPISARLAAARVALEDALGASALIEHENDIAEFRDPYEGPGATRHQPAFVVQPANVAGVQAVLRIASAHGLHVWTSSMGRNYGYGGSAPVENGAIIINLRRMNRIIEIDEEKGYAVVEPGVSFADLYAEVQRRGLALHMSVPDLGWGSIIGNALEHGWGYTRHGEHASALCGMEVVLADGRILRTGQGATTGSPLWHCHRRSFGPGLEDLFKQSNFGIVTRAGLWLAPRPETIVTGNIITDRAEDIVPLIETLRPLLRDNTIQGVPLMVSNPGDARELAAHAPFTPAVLRSVMRPGRWNVRIGLYGRECLVAARRSLIEREIGRLDGVRLELRSYAGTATAEEVEPRDLVACGIPNQLLRDNLIRTFGPDIGHIDFSPVIPLQGEAMLRQEAMMAPVLEKHELIGGFGWVLRPRSAVGACMMMFDASRPERVSAAHAAVREMCDHAAGWGWTEYRAHIALAAHVASKSDFGDHIISDVFSRIKNALDPAGILSPGNHGIVSRGSAPAGESAVDGSG